MSKQLSNKLLTMSIQDLSALLSRTQLAARLGYQYSGDRDIYEALGYKKNLIYDDYATQYERQDIAKAIINRPVEATWQGDLKIEEMSDDKDTDFEKAYEALEKDLHFKVKFIQLDKLSSLGRYGCLFLGFDDTQDKTGFAKPVAPGKGRKLLYLRPLSENSATIDSYVTDAKDPRYGLPLYYSLQLKKSDVGQDAIKVHYSRVIHVTGETMESEVEGIPALKAVFNRLKDLEKLVGGSAEMFWRNARPGYQGEVDKDYRITTETQEQLEDQMDEFEHNLRRFLIMKGIKFTELGAKVSDPDKHVDVQIQMISAVTGIPKRILTGSERGELSSTEDKSMWLDMISSRRHC